MGVMGLGLGQYSVTVIKSSSPSGVWGLEVGSVFQPWTRLKELWWRALVSREGWGLLGLG